MHRASRLALAAFLAFTGTAHFVNADWFLELMPPWLPGDHELWNYAAGVAELGAAGLLTRESTARLGGWLAFWTFAIVWIANLDHIRRGGIPGAVDEPWAAWIRAPLQIPLLWWSWRIAHREPEPDRELAGT